MGRRRSGEEKLQAASLLGQLSGGNVRRKDVKGGGSTKMSPVRVSRTRPCVPPTRFTSATNWPLADRRSGVSLGRAGALTRERASTGERMDGGEGSSGERGGRGRGVKSPGQETALKRAVRSVS